MAKHLCQSLSRNTLNIKRQVLAEPEEVKINTKAYKQESDIFMQFMNETIEKDVGSQIMVDDGYFMFREWYKTSGSTAKIPQKKDFIKNMNSKYRKSTVKIF